MRRRAFTLVELLVVIGIIAVLISILLPVLNRVRDNANQIKCASNLKSFGQGFGLYIQNYKGIVPPGRMPKDPNDPSKSAVTIGSGQEYRPRWFELCGNEMKTYANLTPKPTEDDSWNVESQMYICASLPEWTNSRNYTFGYNHQFLGNARPKDSDKKKWINWPVQSSTIRAPDRTVMAADSMGTAAGKPRKQRSGHLNDGTKDRFAMGNKGFLLDPPRLTSDSDYADPEKRDPADRSGPDPRHRGKANVVFCDGHVDLMTLEDMGYVVTKDGSIAASNLQAHNKLFSGNALDKDPPSVK